MVTVAQETERRQIFFMASASQLEISWHPLLDLAEGCIHLSWALRQVVYQENKDMLLLWLKAQEASAEG